jgi:two-component system cell cycle sensor histidine kinase/response regulator CckA
MAQDPQREPGEELAERQRALAVRVQEALPEVAHDFIFVVDRQLGVSYVNRFAAVSLGRRPEEIVGTPLAHWFPAETTQRMSREIERVLAEGEPLYSENETPFRDGPHWLDTWLVPLRNEAGEPYAVLGISRDISTRKQAEHALRESEERYRTLVETSPDGITVTDLEGRFIMVNRSALELQGYASFEDLLASGRTVFDLISPDERERAMANTERTFAEGSVSNIEYILVRADGSTYPSEVSARVIYHADGKPKSMVGLARDITERKRAEAALSAEKERLQVTLASIADGVVTTDIRGQVVLVNPVAAELIGWSPAEAAGRPLGQALVLLDPKTREPHEDLVRRVLDSSQAARLDRRAVLVARDGSERTVAASAAPIRAVDGVLVGVVLVVHDVTEQDKLERELQRVENLDSLGILAAGIAHDVNNIMTAILGNISLAKAYGKGDAQVFARLREAEQAIGRAKDLTQQLLTFAKGTAPIKRTTSIGELIRETASFALRGSEVALGCRIGPDLWSVEVDEGQIAQVISNLVLNADQAQLQGGTVDVVASNVLLPEEASVPLMPGRYVRISVHDRGSGIAPENLSRIFDPYFTTKPRGSGLGLTICHAIVRNHGGHLTAESASGEGTVFHVYLPASRESAPPSSQAKVAVVRGSGRVLVADDDRAIREVSQLMLQFLGYEVETAAAGAEAIELYRAAMAAGRRFDLVLVDLTMPGGLGGKETMAQLLDIDPEACGVVSSGYSEDPVMAETGKYGFRAAVVKPYRIEEISQTLAAVIGARRG